MVTGKIIEQVINITELGVEISNTRNNYKAVDTKWRRQHKAIVRPIMAYGIKTRADTNSIKQLIWRTEMNTLTTIVGKTRGDWVRNKIIKDECNITEIMEFVRRRRWFNIHVQREEENRLMKKRSREVQENMTRKLGIYYTWNAVIFV